MGRSRGFCFTINNYTEDDEKAVLALEAECQYLICGRELAPTTGTPHLQGYVHYASARSYDSIQKKLPRACIREAKGNAEQNQVYCSKAEDLLIERGTPPKQGKRNDIDRVREMIRDTPRMSEIVDKAPSYQAIKIAEIYLKYHEEKRDWKPEVKWFYGPTGTGKTRTAREWLGPDVYQAMDSIHWWEGYDGHENVLIDDFRPDFCKFHQLLKLLDRYPYRVETKGGSRSFLAKKIAITAPLSPQQMFNVSEDIGQLLRRIDEIVELHQEKISVAI